MAHAADAVDQHQLRALGLQRGDLAGIGGQIVAGGEVALIGGVGLRIGKQIVILAHLGFNAVFRVDPVDRRTLDLAAVGRVAAAGFGVILGVDLDDVSVFIALAACAAN